MIYFSIILILTSFSTFKLLADIVDSSATVIPPAIVTTPIGGGGGRVGVVVGAPQTITGDINKNSKVDKYDFALLMANWGKTGVNFADINKNGKVDKYDFALLMFKWSK